MASIEEKIPDAAPGPGAGTLAAKLRPPLPSPFQVERRALCDAICAASFVKLVLVRAPAGFGKTTALLQCRARLAAAGMPTAWLTFDRADNDVTRFLTSLAAALDQILPPQPLLQDSGEQALAMLDRVARHDAPFTLFLDDLEAIHNPAVASLLWQVIDNLPPGARLVAGTRWVPATGMGRLRARGELLEIEPAQLRFSAHETEAFLRRARGLTLPAAAVDLLHRRTEGWPTALWLASVALERRDQPEPFIAGFSGSHAAIADYLVEDVFSHLEPGVQDFLLRTSILDQLCGPLCDALFDNPPAADSAAVLARLERANLFLMPMEGERYGERGVAGDESLAWYRYHSLFSSFLRAQLARRMGAEVPRLHLAASRWYEAQGRPIPAIEHALAAGDLPQALQRLEAAADDLLAQGRVRLLTRWLDAVPPAVMAQWPKLQVAHAWAVSLTRGPANAIGLLEKIPKDQTTAELRAHMLALRHLLLAMMDRPDAARAFARNELPPLPLGYPFPDGILASSMARQAAAQGDYREARRLLASARQAVSGSDANFVKIFSESIEGIIDLRQGHLQQALARFRIAASTMLPNRFGRTNGNAMAGLLLAEGLYETGDSGAAERLLNVYLPLARDLGLADQIIYAHLVLARIAFERGDVDRAYEWLTELQNLGHHRGLARLVLGAQLERARLALQQGNRHAAAEALQQAADAIGEASGGSSVVGGPVSGVASETDDLVSARLRLALLTKPDAATCDALADEFSEAIGGGRMRRALKLRILLAMACHALGDAARARREMEEALRFGAAEGFVRIFADEGEPLRPLVAEACASLREALPAAYVERLLAACGVAPGREASRPTLPGPIEPLTPKEQKVLQLLAEGFSNQAMGQRLFVSETTVRTHLRNINAKLRASNRTQAVAIARQMGLL